MEKFYNKDLDCSHPPQYGTGQMYLGDKTEDDILRWRRHYYAKISFIDEKIGHILDALERKGILDETLIVLTSDHGDNLGDHNLIYKWLMTEQSTRVPTVFRFPKGQVPPRVDSGLFTQMDIGPTLLDYAGIPVPEYLDGNSNLKRLIENDPSQVPDKVYCQDNYLTMVRTATHRMIHYAGQPYGEYYDILNDPFEQHNLYDSAEHQHDINKLKLEYLEWRAVSSYTGSVERTQKASYEKRKWPAYYPHDPYFLAGQAKPESPTSR
jgi:arylsulfatase A-like enzyme